MPLSRPATRSLLFFLFWILSLVVFRPLFRALLSLSLQDERYTHLVLMPFLTLGLILLHRRRIFGPMAGLRTPETDGGLSPRAGGVVLALAVLFHAVLQWLSLPLAQDVPLALATASLVLLWVGGFILFYGLSSFRAALFPLSLLLLMIPLPASVVSLAEAGLQQGSAEVTHVLFQLTRTPVFREDLQFTLPGITIEVARECSGIRSSIALLISSLVLSHLFLHSLPGKMCLVLLTVPITIFKNAVRISTLSWLGAYVSRDYVQGDLHRQGGLPFTVLALALLVPALLALHRAERAARLRPLPPGVRAAG